MECGFNLSSPAPEPQVSSMLEGMKESGGACRAADNKKEDQYAARLFPQQEAQQHSVVSANCEGLSNQARCLSQEGVTAALHGDEMETEGKGGKEASGAVPIIARAELESEERSGEGLCLIAIAWEEPAPSSAPTSVDPSSTSAGAVLRATNSSAPISRTGASPQPGNKWAMASVASRTPTGGAAAGPSEPLAAQPASDDERSFGTQGGGIANGAKAKPSPGLLSASTHSDSAAPAGTSLHSRSSKKKSAKGPRVDERSSEWLTAGSPYVGLQIKRSFFDKNGVCGGFGIGSVVGWLPSEISEFMSAKTNEPAALWRIVFDEAHKSDVVHTRDFTRFDAFKELGSEDLEEDEVRVGRAMFLAHQREAKAGNFWSWYECKNNDTPRSVGQKLNCDPDLIVKLSKSQGPTHTILTVNSRMIAGSWLLIPPAIPYHELERKLEIKKDSDRARKRKSREIEEEEMQMQVLGSGSKDRRSIQFANQHGKVVEGLEKISKETPTPKWTRHQQKKASDDLANQLLVLPRSTSPESKSPSQPKSILRPNSMSTSASLGGLAALGNHDPRASSGNEEAKVTPLSSRAKPGSKGGTKVTGQSSQAREAEPKGGGGVAPPMGGGGGGHVAKEEGKEGWLASASAVTDDDEFDSYLARRSVPDTEGCERLR